MFRSRIALPVSTIPSNSYYSVYCCKALRMCTGIRERIVRMSLSVPIARVTLSVRDSGKGIASDILRSVTQDGIG